ncbi:hypothetical protein ACPF3V_003416 [Vibrio cholerae]|uniref:hypothetical protein n=1 Tax=Vibrio cholerae TaxID=666 RepID=UPI00028CA1E5|nr:hypothetical protein [Vibrio cholerae]AOY48554.1 hypothetical protein NH62_22367 [Vibrio cholerae]AOY52202.1 hypothetical protein AP033_22407 [Vibrio cholerae]EKG73721.1 hypothetical protein VCCP103710_0242 [Vibrio cholerae CP1037(10)]NOF63788.1 hypothetical protein [Vibrio cholerae]QHQ91279.1 hypothetical protein FKV26_12180 [Vibrio cholerae O1]
MNKYQATLFSNESDIYTALHANQSKLAGSSLRKLALNRGIIFPKKLKREELIDRISDLPFSYAHVREIQDKLASKTNQESFSVKRIYDGFDIDQLHDVIKKVKDGRPKLLGNESIESSAAIGTYIVNIDYTEFDFRRSKFQQKKLYSGAIMFIVRQGYVSIRYTYTSRIAEILEEIIDTYKATVNSNITVNEIDLSAITDADFRNTFAIHLYDFDGLYKGTGFEYAGLEKVRVSRIKSPLLEEKPEDRVEVDEEVDNEDALLDYDADSIDGDDDLDKDAKEDDNENLTFNINNASYDGMSLVNAPQIKELCKDGFYRSQIRWKSIATFLSNCIITFELGFEEKYFGKEVKFKILFKETSNDAASKDKLSDAEFDQVIRKLEDKIFQINDYIIEEHGKRYPQADNDDSKYEVQEAS